MTNEPKDARIDAALAAEQEHDARMAARLDDPLFGEPSLHFTMHIPSRGPRDRKGHGSAGQAP